MSYNILPPLARKNQRVIQTWHLLLFVIAINLLLVWLFNEFILTRTAYHQILSEQMETMRIDAYFDFSKSVSAWGYAISPVILLAKLTFVTLLIQMPLVLMMIEVPFKILFRWVTWASLSLAASGLFRFTWLIMYGPEQIKNRLNTAPLSINHLLAPSEHPDLLYTALGAFNFFEVAWGYTLYRGLISVAAIRKDTAVYIIVLIWLSLTAFQWGLAAYFQGVTA